MAKVSLDVEYTSGKKKKITKKNKEIFLESSVIISKTLADAKNMMLSDIKDDYNNEESWRLSTAEKVDFVSVMSLKHDTFKSDVKTIRMKNIGTKL